MDKHLSGMIRPYQVELLWLTRLLDIALAVACLWCALRMYGYPWTERYDALAYVTVVLLYVASGFCRVYRSWRLNPLHTEAAQVVLAWLAVTFAILVLGYVTKTTHEYSRLAVGTWFLLTPVCLVGWRAVKRLLLRRLRERGHNSRSVAIVGTGEMGERVARTILDTPEMGLALRGFYDDRKPPRAEVCPSLGVPLLGRPEELLLQAHDSGIDVIYVTYPMQAENRIRELVERFSDTVASLYVVPDSFLFDLFHGRWVQVGQLPAVSVHETPFFGVNALAKRIEDILIAGFALCLAALPMLLIAVGVKLSSPGSVFFRQRRYGLDGNPFWIWKYRTMVVAEDGDDIPQAQPCDRRVTRFGAFLRRTSLDELPQLFNVLTGFMSVVGPRPHALAHNEYYRKRIQAYMVRHKVKPGITGWAQVNGLRGETATRELMEKRVECDLWYIRNWSISLDLRIILKTISVVFRQVNAY